MIDADFWFIGFGPLCAIAMSSELGDNVKKGEIQIFRRIRYEI